MKIVKALESCRGAHSSPCVHLQEKHHQSSCGGYITTHPQHPPFSASVVLVMSALLRHLGPTYSLCGVSYGCVPALEVLVSGHSGASSDLGLRWATSLRSREMDPKLAFDPADSELDLR